MVLGLVFFASGHAIAIEPLRFSKDIGAVNALRLAGYLNDYTIAQVDLNGDGIEEFILRSDSCGQSPQRDWCDYKILARKGSATLELGHIEARRVLLGNDTTNGIRNFIVYNDPSSDFAYSVYAWDKTRSTFRERPK